MRRTTAAQEANTWQYRVRAGNGISQSLLEPADGARADATQNDAPLVGLAQNLDQPPFAPEREHTLGVPTTHVDHIFFKQERCQIGSGPCESRQSGSAAVQLGKSCIET